MPVRCEVDMAMAQNSDPPIFTSSTPYSLYLLTVHYLGERSKSLLVQIFALVGCLYKVMTLLLGNLNSHDVSYSALSL
jgi:hypothetical protein